MAVYTQLSIEEIQPLADRLGIGRIIAATGVAAGVENSTYFLSTLLTAPAASLLDKPSNECCEYVLTIAETISIDDLRFIAALCTYLSEQNLPIPAPLADGTGESALLIAGKPGMVVSKLPGTHPEHPTIGQCKTLGGTLGRLHLATRASGIQRESHRSLKWVAVIGKQLIDCVDAADQALLADELEFLAEFVSANNHLPQAIIHGDLFRDNTLFLKENLTAIIDFFSAGSGFLLLDLAIAANDWCRTGDEISLPHIQALTASYSAVRSLDSVEIETWPQFLRIGALRFWVSRLAEHYLGDKQRPPGQGKNPAEYRKLLLRHRDHPLAWKS